MTDMPEWVKQAQAKWRYRGQMRPLFSIEPKPGQESVWDYPRPPRLQKDFRKIQIRANGKIVAESQAAFRVLETASPPTFYIPPNDVDTESFTLGSSFSLCEWKGKANYWCMNVDGVFIEDIAWTYADPYPGFELIAGCFSFYPNRLACYVDGERVQAQAGQLYGGWITSEIVGPFKGEPGTENW